MRLVAIVQARMGSSRLPGKVLMDLGGRTVLERVLRRLSRAKRIEKIVVATSVSAVDDPILEECRKCSVDCFRGSEHDVLDRYYKAAGTSNWDAIVRITSDCPVIDPELVDETVKTFEEQEADYASNAIEPGYPRGLDVEVFTFAALESAWKNARKPYEREHVTPYVYEHPERFRVASLGSEVDYSGYRWTLDTQQDLELLRAIYREFGDEDAFSWRQVIQLMEDKPELGEINSGVAQKGLQS